jgi:anaerobic magnesium-protoporphyrin IX monomethyl ester cyclase
MIRVALVGPEQEENLSLRYLASSLMAAGFKSDIVPFDGADELPRVLSSLLNAGELPALVGLSLSFQLRAKDFLALAIALRQKSYGGHITAGGHFGTFACKEILKDFPEIDSICRHEAEETLVRLAKAIHAGNDLKQVSGLAYRDADGDILLTGLRAPVDLHTLPWPDRRGTPSQCLGHAVAPLVASRGCYANCTFCCISAWHELTLPGKRFRLRPVEDVANEMAWLHRQKRIEIFIFHDDNFFLPDRDQTLERICSLAEALRRRGIRNFVSIVKARPNDLDHEIVEILKERLGLIRLYLGVESDSEMGLRTLGRRVGSAQNHQAMELLERAGVYACFNMLIFDPSTKIEDLETNLAFMEKFAEVPQNFGRVELYAGTPLLALMQAKGRCQGDYLEWDYRMADEHVQRIFELAMECFYERNFSGRSAAHRLMGTRFCVEVAARFHPEVFCETWRTEAKNLNRALTQDSVKAMRKIIGFVKGNESDRDDIEFANALSGTLRKTERRIRKAAGLLETKIQDASRDKSQFG